MDTENAQENETVTPETKLAQVAPHSASPLAVKTPRAIMLAQALEEEREQRGLLRRYVEEFMVVDEDYGVIPGLRTEGRDGKKPRRSLLKPGAEKLLDLFRCRPEYEIISRDIDRETGLYSYEIKCKAVSRETDTVLNEGVGSASSYESKYRYRNSSRRCPQCGKEAIKRSKYPPRNAPDAPPGWYCHDKSGGCGANFVHDDTQITEQESGKIQNPDLADVANTVFKMAKKRAQVDCAIALARVSDMFSQDLEDLDTEAAGVDEPPPHTPPQTAKAKAATVATAARAKQIWDGAQAIGITKDEFPSWVEKALGSQKRSSDWTVQDMERLEAELKAPKDIDF